VDVNDAEEWEDDRRASRGIGRYLWALDLKIIESVRCDSKTGSKKHQFGKVCFGSFNT